MSKKIRINIWKLVPAALDGVRAGTDGLELATAEDSEAGHKVTQTEARMIADRVGKAVADRLYQDLVLDATGG